MIQVAVSSRGEGLLLVVQCWRLCRHSSSCLVCVAEPELLPLPVAGRAKRRAPVDVQSCYSCSDF